MSCDAQNADGVGLCEMLLGWVWTGTGCEPLSGCSCAGADCDSLAASPAECETAHADCYPTGDCPEWNDPAVRYHTFDSDVCALVRITCAPGLEFFSSPDCGCGCAPPQPAMCGGFGAFMCEGENEYCDYGAHCGSGDQSGLCQVKPDGCFTLFDPVCGCDDVTYSNSCFAAAAGVSVQFDGTCAPAPDSCQSHCGGQSEDASCWCDSLCTYYGDCCGDKTAACG